MIADIHVQVLSWYHHFSDMYVERNYGCRVPSARRHLVSVEVESRSIDVCYVTVLYLYERSEPILIILIEISLMNRFENPQHKSFQRKRL